MQCVLLVLDVGSSSIRCTAYEYRKKDTRGDGVAPHRSDQGPASPPSSPSPPRPVPMEGVRHTIPLTAIVPSTGHIRIYKVLSAIDECVDEVLRLLRRRKEEMEREGQPRFHIVGIGFSTFVTNLVGIDIFGDPVSETATVSYACNRRDVVNECHRLRANLGPERVQKLYQRTGTPLHPSYALPQLLAFYGNENNRTLAKQIDRWTTISAICIHRWCGKPNLQMPVSYSEASWTGMLNFQECAWDKEAAELFEQCKGVTQYCHDEDDDDEIDLLSPLVDYDAALPFLTNGVPQCNYGDSSSTCPYWDRWPELKSSTVNLFLGIGDGAAANVGSKCGGYSMSGSASYRVAVTIGTSAAVRVCLPLKMHYDLPSSIVSVPNGLFCYRLDRGTILIGGALTDGGSVVEWARSLLNLQSKESFDACLAEVSDMYKEHCASSPPADAPVSSRTGVTMIPFLGGERSTGFRGGAHGCLSGLTRDTSSAHIMYACLESVILRLGCIAKMVNETAGLRPKQSVIVASGNALGSSPLWQQMLADATSMDVLVDADASSEGTSRGVAIMMAGALQLRETGNAMASCNFEETLEVAHQTKARTQMSQHWKDALSTQESLIGAVAPTWNDG